MKPLRLVRGHLDGGRSDVHRDYEALPVEESARLARGLLERLHGAKLTKRKPTDGGVCDDCKHTVAVRWTFGRVTVCRRCVLSRMGAAAAITRAEPGLDVSERSQVAREYAALEQLGKDEETKP